MARGGAILAATLERLSAEVRPGISTKALDTVAEEYIRSLRAARS
jgi:methionine aminopeptidase